MARKQSDRPTDFVSRTGSQHILVTFERVDEKVLVGRDIAEAIGFQFALGPAGETIREAGPLAERQRPAIEAALAALFRTAETTAEGIWMDSSSWVIRARAPGA